MSEIWERLQRVKHLRLHTKELDGTAAVRVEQPAPFCLLFHESGSWETGIAFTNLYRWTRFKEGVSLHHLRRGKAVLLFHFIDNASVPHFCGKDCYTAKLALSPEGILLSWQVKGPKKDTWGEYFYS